METRKVENGETIDLAVGTVLKFVEGAVEYTVDAIDTASVPPKITLKRSLLKPHESNVDIGGYNGATIDDLCPETLTWAPSEKDRALPIGRDMSNHEKRGIVVPNLLVSRLCHGLIRYSSSGTCFQYHHNSMNPIMVDEPEGKSGDHAASSIHTVTGPGAGEKLNLVIPLVKGTSIAFCRHTPTYKVTKADIGNRHLILENTGKPDKRYPATIEISDEFPRTLGSDADRNIRFDNKVISGHQGVIRWSDKDHNFIYECTGRAMPIVHASEALAIEQEKICAELNMGPALAREQLREVESLLERIDRYQAQLNDVQDLEWSIVGKGQPGGWQARRKTEDSQIGYALWLESLSILYHEKLKPEEKRDIAKMAGVLHRIADDRAELRDIENHRDFPLTGEHKKRMEDYVARKTAEFKSSGEVYLVSGFHGHHTISRLKEDGGGRRLTVYNAGAEAVPVQFGGQMMSDMVLGMYEHDIKPGTDVKKLIGLISEKKIRPPNAKDYYPIFKEIENCLNPELGRHRIVQPQTRGNCTTRSTRHALEDALGDHVMAMFGRVIANPEVSAAEDIKEALEKRKAKLQSIVGVGTPADDRIHRTALGEKALGV